MPQDPTSRRSEYLRLISWDPEFRGQLNIPQCTNNHSCKHQPSVNFGGHASNATVSPTSPARCWSYSQRMVFSFACTPIATLFSRVPDLRSASPELLNGISVLLDTWGCLGGVLLVPSHISTSDHQNVALPQRRALPLQSLRNLLDRDLMPRDWTRRLSILFLVPP